MIVGFNHSGFVVKDIEKQIRFYVDVLDLQVIRTFSSDHQSSQHTGLSNAYRELVFLGKPGKDHMLELIQFIEPEITNDGHIPNTHIGAAHICFNVENLKEFYEKLCLKAMVFLTEPITRKDDHGTSISICYGRDPEGNWIEFIETTTI